MSISIKQIMQVQKDNRFTFNKEYCGSHTPLYVTRFMGEYIGASNNKNIAYEIAVNSKYFIEWLPS